MSVSCWLLPIFLLVDAIVAVVAVSAVVIVVAGAFVRCVAALGVALVVTSVGWP